MTVTYTEVPDHIEITESYLASGTDFTATMQLQFGKHDVIEVSVRRVEDILDDEVYPHEEWYLPDNIEFVGNLADWQDEFLQELMQLASDEAHRILEDNATRMLAVLNKWAA